MAADPVTEALAEPGDRLFQPGVLERSQGAAALADGVMMVRSSRDHRFVAAAAAADLDSLHQAFGAEQVEGPVDGRGANPLAAGADPLADRLGAEAALLVREQLDHRALGFAGSSPLARERLQGQLGPVLVGPTGGHGDESI